MMFRHLVIDAPNRREISVTLNRDMSLWELRTIVYQFHREQRALRNVGPLPIITHSRNTARITYVQRVDSDHVSYSRGFRR
jgi:hypothetical protein